jgi:uncharacterized protein (DUF2267 family)
MHPIARELLRKLLDQADRGGRPSVAITERSARAYFQLPSPAERELIHAALENAEAAGAVTLDRGRGAASRDLVRVRLADADRLAAHLGEPRAAQLAARIEQALRAELRDAPDWLRTALDDALARWRRGAGAFGTPAADTETARRLFQVARAVAAGEHRELDLRRFSVRLLGDTKAVERLLGRLADLLRRNPAWADIDDDAQLQQALGLEKFAPPVFLKGPLRLRYGVDAAGASDFELAPLQPYVAIAPDAVHAVGADAAPPYLLTIENLASFQRHVREVADRGLVLYTAGFPAPALVRFLRELDAALPADCPFFHWGDRDPGGLGILDAVSKACPRHPVQPHLMDTSLPDCPAFTPEELHRLQRLAAGDSQVAAIARRWIDTGPGRLEQEAVDPTSPVAGGA